MNIENKYYMIEKGDRCISITFFIGIHRIIRKEKEKGCC